MGYDVHLLKPELGGQQPEAVSDRVTSVHRAGGVVIKIDKAGNAGLGQIDVRCPDGAVTSGIFPDGGFEREG